MDLSTLIRDDAGAGSQDLPLTLVLRRPMRDATRATSVRWVAL
jgi:hypothetical protein